MSDHVSARWVGPFEAHLPDNTVLVPGETVVEIPAGEAEASSHWEPVQPPKPSPSFEPKNGGDS